MQDLRHKIAGLIGINLPDEKVQNAEVLNAKSSKKESSNTELPNTSFIDYTVHSTTKEEG